MEIIVMKGEEELESLKIELTEGLSPANVVHHDLFGSVEYPCVCAYTLEDDPNGPYRYYYEAMSVTDILKEIK